MNKTKECSAVDLHQCWAQGDTVNDDNGGYPHAGVSESFVDAQGRSWALYIPQESAFFVDTNGFKKPNQFGKDRWMFRPKTAENIVISIGVPAKITNWFGDQTSTGSNWCNHPPCYYSSWLYK